MNDTHCHLADHQFDHDIDQVVQRAKAAGVTTAIVCAEFRSDFERVLQLAETYPDFIRPALGIHPVQSGNVSAAEVHFDAEVEGFIRSSHAESKIVAIGEVGLDFTPRYLKDAEVDKAAQREVLARQIALANELDLPVNVHSRSAGRPTIAWLIEHGARKVQMHAYSGNPKTAKPGIDAGFYFSVPPSFSLTTEREGLIKAVPLDQLLLETDSPVLGPSRDERNEPANIRVSAELIARIKGISVDEVIETTTVNAKRLYSL